MSDKNFSSLVPRAFTNHDWDGLAGAERPASGEEPWVAYADEFLAVADANGVYVLVYDADGDSDVSYQLTCKFALAQVILHGLPEVLTHNDLISMGFEKI